MRMRRLVMSGPRRVELAEADLSEAPLAPHEILLRTRYSAISPGTELAYYGGEQDLGHRATPYPFYPGYAAVGEVLAAGAEAPVRPGDLALAHIPHQSAARFDGRAIVCVPVPDGVPPELATLARLAQVSAVSIRLMRARAGDRAAVIGLGLVGNLAAQLLRAAGLRVLGVETLPERRALAERCGITDTLDPMGSGALSPSVLDSCDVVLECSGQDRGVVTALALAARYGEVFLVGAAWKRGQTVVAADVVRPVFNKYLALRSGWEWQIPRYGEEPPGSIAGCTAWALACLRTGALRVRDLITDHIAPADAPDAYSDLLARPAAHLGIIIDWGDLSLKGHGRDDAG